MKKNEEYEIRKYIKIAKERTLSESEKEKIKNIFSNNGIEVDVEVFNELCSDGICSPGLKQSSFIAMIEKFSPIDIHDHDLDTALIIEDIKEDKNSRNGYPK